jgi:hypothetical protein
MTHASRRRPVFKTWLYTDGRVIWSRAGDRPWQVPEGATELDSGLLEQRLTPEGVELLRSEVARLLDRNRALLVPLPADYESEPARLGRIGDVLTLFLVSGPHGWGTVEARNGDHFVGLHWDRWSGRAGRADGPIATPEQASDVLRLDSILTEPSSLLPASAWAVWKIRAYVPSHYQVCMDARRRKMCLSCSPCCPRRPRTCSAPMA